MPVLWLGAGPCLLAMEELKYVLTCPALLQDSAQLYPVGCCFNYTGASAAPDMLPVVYVKKQLLWSANLHCRALQGSARSAITPA